MTNRKRQALFDFAEALACFYDGFDYSDKAEELRADMESWKLKLEGTTDDEQRRSIEDASTRFSERASFRSSVRSYSLEKDDDRRLAAEKGYLSGA